MIRLLPLLLFLSCTVNDLHGIEVADEQEMPNQGAVLEYTQSRFEDTYRVRVEAFEHSIVWWTDTTCPTKPDTWAVVYRDTCYHGLTWSCEEIFVAKNRLAPQDLCSTALVHEFGHCLLLEAGMDGDISHANTEFWEFMKQVRNEACAE